MADALSRKGGWMQTHTGRMFWPLDPRPEDVDIEDIAHSLSQICRFTGHTRYFYSVAQHCVHVCEEVIRLLEADLRRGILLAGKTTLAEWGRGSVLHDADETYTGDMHRVLKHHPDLLAFRIAGHRCQGAIFDHFEVPALIRDHPLITGVDAAIVINEGRDLLGPHPAPWGDRNGRIPDPIPNLVIEPWSPSGAKKAFLATFERFARS